MLDYIRLMRPLNCAMSALAVFLGAFIVEGTGLLALRSARPVLIAMAAVVFFVGAGNALNDYEDRELDKKAHPERPVPSGRMRPESARGFAYACFAASAVFGAFTGFPRLALWPLLLLLLNVVLMVSYETRFKKEGLPGNFLIAYLVSSLFLFGALSAGHVSRLVLLFVAMALLSIFGREVAKDIEDVEGDRGERVTAPMTYGVGKASAFASAGFALAVAISPLPYLLGLFPWHYLAVVAFADAIFIYCIILLSKNKPGRAQNFSKLAMLVSLAAFAAGVLAG